MSITYALRAFLFVTYSSMLGGIRIISNSADSAYRALLPIPHIVAHPGDHTYLKSYMNQYHSLDCLTTPE